jgi:hypothetical protein
MAKTRKPFNQERIDYAKQHKIAERQLLPMFRRALMQSIHPVINWADSFGLDGLDPEILINRNVWGPVYQRAFNEIGVKFARREYYHQRKEEGFAEAEEKAFGIGFLIDVWIGKLKDFAANYSSNIATELNDYTAEIIKRALGESGSLELDALGRVRWFIKEIKDRMRTRSLNISRTEATRTSNLGKEIGARSWIDEQGGGGYKMWLGREDERERNSHMHVNNVIIPIDDFYTVGGSLALRPGDTSLPAKEIINCRCSQSLMSQNRYNQLLKRDRIQNGRVV